MAISLASGKPKNNSPASVGAFLEFRFAIPRDQTVRVGQRRFLVKRALAGIVSDEILNRKKKLTAPQETAKGATPEWPSLQDVGWRMHPPCTSTGVQFS